MLKLMPKKAWSFEEHEFLGVFSLLERLFYLHSSDVVEDDDDRKHPQAAVCRAVRSRSSPVPGVAVQDKGVDFRPSSDHDGV